MIFRWLALTPLLFSAVLMAQDVDQPEAKIYGEGGVLSINPKTILRLRKESNTVYDAKRAPVDDLKAVTDETTITLAYDEPVTKVYAARFQPTVISFFDATGAPWPILRAKAYNNELLAAEAVENSFNNSFILNARDWIGKVFVSVFMKDLARPITLEVDINRNIYHHIKTLRIDSVGPSAVATASNFAIANRIGQEGDEELNNILFNVTPAGSLRLPNQMKGFDAWLSMNGDLLVRSRVPIFTPQYKRLEKSADGQYTAYRFDKVTPIYAASQSGEVITIHLDFEAAKKSEQDWREFSGGG